MTPDWINQLKWDEQGLIPAIAQDEITGKILMFAWMNKESIQQTQEKGFAVYWSRSRQKLWAKGEESGNTQKIKSIRTDCDKDVVLLTIEQVGGIACHTGRESCFFNKLEQNKTIATDRKLEWQVKEPVLKDPKLMYGK